VLTKDPRPVDAHHKENRPRWTPWYQLLKRTLEVDGLAWSPATPALCGQRMALRAVVMPPATLSVLEGLTAASRGPPDLTPPSRYICGVPRWWAEVCRVAIFGRVLPLPGSWSRPIWAPGRASRCQMGRLGGGGYLAKCSNATYPLGTTIRFCGLGRWALAAVPELLSDPHGFLAQRWGGVESIRSTSMTD
jgi:hypothetical protein